MILPDKSSSLFDCEITVTLDGLDLTLTGWALGRDTVLYNLNLTGSISGLNHDANENYTGVFDLDEAVITHPDDFVAALTVTNANNEKLVMKFMSIMIIDEQLNVGEYRIDDAIYLAQGDQVVFSSIGIEGEEIYPSYVAKLDEYGNPIETWFFKAGKVEVAGDLSSITVDAVNSLYKTINITVSKSTGIESVHDAQGTMHNGKFLHNGQLYIRKDGKTYTIMGVEE